MLNCTFLADNLLTPIGRADPFNGVNIDNLHQPNMKFKTVLLTLFVAIDLSDDDLARGAELLLGLLCELVPDGGEHVGEAAPVRVEVDEHELVVGWN